MSLTKEQIHLFRHNGYIKLPARQPQFRVDALKEAIWRDINDEVVPVSRNREGRVVRISDVWGRGQVFQEAMTSSEVLDPLEILLGPNIELLTNRHNHATLRTKQDSGVNVHRDVLQWSRTILTVIFYLEDTNVKNGCTWIIPGSHLLPGISENSIEKNQSLAESGILDQRVALPVAAGSMVAIDSMVIHGAGENHTDGTRMSMTVGYHSMDELADYQSPRRVLVRGERIYGGNDGFEF